MKVSVVIPNFNGEQLLAKNLPYLLKAQKNSNNNISEIIIVDDKSEDNSVKFLEENYKDKVKLIRHTKNRGFSSTVNTGVRMAKSGLICLINTDVIVSTDFLVAALPHFEDKNVFAVSLHEEGFGYTKGVFHNGFIEHRGAGQPKKTTETFWVSGGSGIFRRSIWMKLKGLDEALFSPFYWEDLDICYRAMKLGYKLLWEPNAKVIHNHESTTKNLNQKYVSRIKERNQLLLIWKNLTSKRLFRKHLQGLLSRTLRHPGYIKIIIAALGKLGLVRMARSQQIKIAKVSDEAIFAKFQ